MGVRQSLLQGSGNHLFWKICFSLDFWREFDKVSRGNCTCIRRNS